jgi:pSer/pThr/pTyr-binding forkhead associated (FHA) protein
MVTPTVVLVTVAGSNVGSEHRFAERTVCIVGRDPECGLRLPNDTAHQLISRYHCLLDINPPDLTIRDFGSLNGTFVNGTKIGQRPEGQSRDAAIQATYPERPIRHGDRIELGKTIFEVRTMTLPAVPPPGAAAAFVQDPKPELGAARPLLKCKCSICGREVPLNTLGVVADHICSQCRAQPGDVLKALLKQAVAGAANVHAIRGFSIEKELGRGGMGAVYLAKKDGSEERVALKVMLPRIATQETARQMFLREVEVMLSLQHPNVVALRDVGCSAGVFFVTLEYCDGGSVDKLIEKSGGKLSVSEALRITLQAIDGLDYAHTLKSTVRTADGRVVNVNGLVHRDVKPANIFLSGSARTAKVADFGMAKAFDLAGLSGQTCTGSTAGTPVFMPRQQVLNFKYSRPDVDVWAIAASFYNMVTGDVPREFVRGVDPWVNVLKSKPIPIQKRLPSIPKRLAEVIDTALIDQPAIGISSCAALRKALLSAT